ncbi:conserved hypothetical protein [Ricinus communis]|uniref:Uncharacterized protein n=1 Tax=Ricinus communis TaxID=3988 RepID=B9R989_RICCO|nr:conserved hypothetical protein [Ricinus communis]
MVSSSVVANRSVSRSESLFRHDITRSLRSLFVVVVDNVSEGGDLFMETLKVAFGDGSNSGSLRNWRTF